MTILVINSARVVVGAMVFSPWSEDSHKHTLWKTFGKVRKLGVRLFFSPTLPSVPWQRIQTWNQHLTMHLFTYPSFEHLWALENVLVMTLNLIE